MTDQTEKKPDNFNYPRIWRFVAGVFAWSLLDIVFGNPADITRWLVAGLLAAYVFEPMTPPDRR